MEIFRLGERVGSKFPIVGLLDNDAKSDLLVDVVYIFNDVNNLQVTVGDVWEDDIEVDELLLFLQTARVIESISDWRIDEIADTDGDTFIDDTYTTLTFIR